MRGLLAEACYRQGAFSEATVQLQALGRRALAEVLADFGDANPYTLASAAGSAVLDWVACEPLPVLRALINGRSVNLVIDTGTGEVALDTLVAEELRLPRGAPEQGTFAGGRTSTLRHGRVASLGLGDLELRGVPVQICDIAAVFRAFFPQVLVHGILGTHLLSRFSTTIDYERTCLALRAPGCPPPADHAATDTLSEPFWIAGGHCIVAWASLNRSHKELMFIDTGATGAAVAVPQSTARRAALAARGGSVRAGYGGRGQRACLAASSRRPGVGLGCRMRRDGHVARRVSAGTQVRVPPPRIAWARLLPGAGVDPRLPGHAFIAEAQRTTLNALVLRRRLVTQSATRRVASMGKIPGPSLGSKT